MQAIFTVYKKELRDMFRDKRVRSTTLLMPSLTVLLIVVLMSFVEHAVTAPSNLKVYFVKGSEATMDTALSKAETGLSSQLKKGQIGVDEVPNVDEGKKLIEEGKARLVLNITENTKSVGTFTIDAYYDPKQELSNAAVQAVQLEIQHVNDAQLKQVLIAHDVPTSSMETYHFAKQEVQVGGKSESGQFAVSFIPYLIIIWAFYGGISIATELVAGEKEKNTLETLLISPVTRTQIAFGKYLSLATVCLISSCSSFVALLISQEAGWGGKIFGGSIGLNGPSLALIVLVLLPTVALFASLLLAISSFAKNPREAQTYLAGISTLVLLPAMFSQFIGYTDLASKTWIYVIPVLNTAVNLRQIMLVQFNPAGFMITLAISLVLAAIGIKVAVALFNRESVLARI